jgi:GntR family transcriptional repressor for pyruvate dehydrogenase complex
VVREAVAALRGDGLVIARQGAGVFVAPPGERRPFRIDPEAMDSLANVLALMELRTGVEGEAAALAATRRTQAELRQLDAAMTTLEAAVGGEGDGVQADRAFHAAIMQATHNLYYRAFTTYLGQLMQPRQSVRAMAVPPAERAIYLRRVQDEHARIRDAIAARNADAARQAALEHLRNSRSRIGALRARLARRRTGES